MKISVMECPKCGAKLEVDPYSKMVQCNYCGNYLFLENESGSTVLNKIEQLIYLGETLKAHELLEDLKTNRPFDYNVWFMCIKLYYDSHPNNEYNEEIEKYIGYIAKINNKTPINSHDKKVILDYLYEKASAINKDLLCKEKELDSLHDKKTKIDNATYAIRNVDLSSQEKKIYYYKTGENCNVITNIAIVLVVILCLYALLTPEGSSGLFRIFDVIGALLLGLIVFGGLSCIINIVLSLFNKIMVHPLEAKYENISKERNNANAEFNDVKQQYDNKYSIYINNKNKYDMFMRKIQEIV